MFSGIVRMLAPVMQATTMPAGAASAAGRIAVDLGAFAGDAAAGDSISINGVCLTVAAKSGTVCEFDVVAETLAHTTLGTVRAGDRVNVEPSLRVGDKMGGHFVLGHVDDVGVITTAAAGGSGEIRVSVDTVLVSQMVLRGCVAVDGVSLTLAGVGEDFFTCAIIPTTLEETTLGFRKPGDKVNVETDVLAKIVARQIGGASRAAGITLERLRQFGFA